MPLSPDEADWADDLTSGVRAVEDRALQEIADAARSSRPGPRLRGLLADARRWAAELVDGARRWVSTYVPRAYQAGATGASASLGTSFIWAEPSRAVVDALARQVWADVATTLQGVDESTRRAIRSLLDDAVRRQVLEGLPIVAKDLAKEVQARTGAMTVRYADGSRRSVGDYADTIARTTTATTRNTGTFDQSRAAGVGYMECSDGADCHLGPGHNVGPLANGLVLPIDVAEEHTLSHPRCARAWGARPDVTTDGEAEGARRFSLAEQEAMAVEERDRATRRLVDGRPVGSLATPGRQPRTPRAPRTSRLGRDAS